MEGKIDKAWQITVDHFVVIRKEMLTPEEEKIAKFFFAAGAEKAIDMISDKLTEKGI